MERFRYAGHYRVQGRTTSTPSSLAGVFSPPAAARLDSTRVNAALAARSTWQGRATVSLRAALVDHRSGQFATQNDILYKNDLFTPGPASQPMESNVVDVRKAVQLWEARSESLADFVAPESLDGLRAYLDDLETVVSNEYFVHEAGHFIGYDIQRKYSEGYFRVTGRSAAPLIHLEELRADCHGFGFAIELLSPRQAASLFAYNVLLRFGVHHEGLATRHAAPYGLIPYLLFHALRSLGFLSVTRQHGRSRLKLATTRIDGLVAVMGACDARLGLALTAHEEKRADPLDISLIAAGYVRDALTEQAALAEFLEVFPPGTGS